MENKHIRSTLLIFAFLLVALLTACGPSSDSDPEPHNDTQTEDGVAGISTWQYKMTVVTKLDESRMLQENGTVIFDGTFSVAPSGAIEFHRGKATVSGTYSCVEAFSDPEVVLEGTLSEGHPFLLEGSLIPAEDYDDFDIVPLEPLTSNEPREEYALVSIPIVNERAPVSVSFGREKCTGSNFTPVIAELVSDGKLPPFFSSLWGSKWLVVMLDPQTVATQPIELTDDGSKVLSKAELCVAPAGMCP